MVTNKQTSNSPKLQLFSLASDISNINFILCGTLATIPWRTYGPPVATQTMLHFSSFPNLHFTLQKMLPTQHITTSNRKNHKYDGPALSSDALSLYGQASGAIESWRHGFLLVCMRRPLMGVAVLLLVVVFLANQRDSSKIGRMKGAYA